MINTEQARNLGKAVRVILDEAEMMGLEYYVNVNAKEHIRVLGDRRATLVPFRAPPFGSLTAA